jgi:hypothetical protein
MLRSFSSLRTCLSTLLIVALCLLASSDALAAWDRLSAFATLPAGTGIHGQDGWSIGPTNTDLLIASDPTGSADHVLAVTSSNSYRTAFKAIDLPADGTSTVYFRFYVPSTTTSTDVSFGVLHSLTVDAASTPSTTVRVVGSTLQVHDGSFKNLATLQRNVWHECWIVIDNPADRFEVLLRTPDDTVPVVLNAGGVSSFAFRSGTGNQAMRTFQIRANSAHAGKILYVSDVWLDTVARTIEPPASPSPADLVLMIGSDFQEPWSPTGLSLQGTLEGEGVDLAQTSFAWSKTSGPGTVTFSAPDALTTDVIFSSPGVYVLNLVANCSDGRTASDDIQITLTDVAPAEVTTYASFKEFHFGPNIKKSAAPWADPNNDGVPNLLEFAFGRNPSLASNGTPWTVDLASDGGGGHALVLHYPRDTDAEVILTPEWSASLDAGSWSTAGIGILPADPDGFHAAILPLTPELPTAFMHLRASIPPSGTPNPKVDGFRGIWFTLGQVSAYGDKYSGGLGTYTTSHTPMAIYSPQANKTFFTYGGTPTETQRQLQIMVSYYDHATGLVARPTLVYSKAGVNDPHDNGSLSIDEEGHVWVFVSGRNTMRLGRFFRSDAPFSIERFEDKGEATVTYPQPQWFEDKGFLLLFTKYINGGRQLYWNTSRNGDVRTPDQTLATIGGHYQTSARHGDRIGTAFNRHPNGDADRRTDLYYLQTDDRGTTWTTAAGTRITPPVWTINHVSRVRDYASENRLVYLHNLTFDNQGRPVILYLTSSSHEPGPNGSPRRWEIAHWQGTHWAFRQVTTSTHNYDVGFLRIEDNGVWRIYGPTEVGPQYWGSGGEIALWESSDEGVTWNKVRDLTSASERNHGYVRHPMNAHPDFYTYWADGNPDQISRSYLYFSNREGDRVYRLPYTMTTDFAAPELVIP